MTMMSLALVFMLVTYSVYRYRLRSILQLQQTRAQIAMDLHDDIGSSLSSLSFLSALVQNRATERGSNEELRPILDEIQETSGKLMHSMKDIVWAVDPKQDTLESLLERLEGFAHRVAETGVFSIDVAEDVPSLNMTPQSRRNLYLILKEAITNAAKYSKGSAITLGISRAGNNLHIQVADNGKGFDPSAAHKGYGCRTMRERAHQSGATLTIQSALGQGTTITLLWTYKPSLDFS